MNKNFIRYSIKEAIKLGSLQKFIDSCYQLILDYEYTLYLHSSLSSKEYFNYFYSIEIFLDEYKENYLLAKSFVKYFHSLPDKKQQKYFKLSNKHKKS